MPILNIANRIKCIIIFITYKKKPIGLVDRHLSSFHIDHRSNRSLSSFLHFLVCVAIVWWWICVCCGCDCGFVFMSLIKKLFQMFVGLCLVVGVIMGLYLWGFFFCGWFSVRKAKAEKERKKEKATKL